MVISYNMIIYEAINVWKVDIFCITLCSNKTKKNIRKERIIQKFLCRHNKMPALKNWSFVSSNINHWKLLFWSRKDVLLLQFCMFLIRRHEILISFMTCYCSEQKFLCLTVILPREETCQLSFVYFSWWLHGKS